MEAKASGLIGRKPRPPGRARLSVRDARRPEEGGGGGTGRIPGGRRRDNRAVGVLGAGLGAALLLALAPAPAGAQTECLTTARGLHACRAGSGTPTVVLAAGARLASPTWSLIFDSLAAFTTVVAFDRPGFGGSSARSGPRTPARLGAEVHELLTDLDLPGPFVLVGHSAGGWQVLHHAQQEPDRIVGVVLLDTPHPGFERQRLDLLTDEGRRQRLDALAASRAAAPEAVQAEYAGAEQPGALAFDRFPRTVPLRVISADAQEFGAPELQVAHRDLWLRLQRRWLELSDDARLRIAEGAGHMVHRERPGLVVEVVRELVTGARTPPRSPPDRRE